MSSLQIPSFTCPCDSSKIHTVTCDGGIKNGNYRLILCDSCYENEDNRKFVISDGGLELHNVNHYN